MWEFIVVSHRRKNASSTISTLQKSSSLFFSLSCILGKNSMGLSYNLDIIIRRCRVSSLRLFLEFNYFQPAILKIFNEVSFYDAQSSLDRCKEIMQLFLRLLSHCHFFNDVLVLPLMQWNSRLLLKWIICGYYHC